MEAPISPSPNATSLTPEQVALIHDLQDALDCPQMKHAVGFWAVNVFYTLGIFWLISWVLDLVFSRVWPVYRKASILTRRNIITYFHEIFITTAAMIWMFTLLDPILFNPDFTPDRLRQLGTIALILCCMYLFELIYRLEMRWQLILHHLLTIMLVIMSIYKLETESTVGPPPVVKEYNVKGAVLLALTALTEQPIFVGLLLYRVGYKYPWVFFFSAAQNLVFKLTLHVGVIIMYVKDEVWRDNLWKWFLPVAISVCLLAVQVFACWVQLQIGLRLKARLEEEKAAEICLERAGVPVSQIEMLKKKSTRQLVNLAKKASDLEVSHGVSVFETDVARKKSSRTLVIRTDASIPRAGSAPNFYRQNRVHSLQTRLGIIKPRQTVCYRTPNQPATYNMQMPSSGRSQTLPPKQLLRLLMMISKTEPTQWKIM